MNPRRALLEKISDVQRELMSHELEGDYKYLVPVVLDTCQKHGLTFYFNFLEDSVVLNIVDWTSDDYSELHVRLNLKVVENANFNMNTIKFLVLCNAFLLTEQSSQITNPYKEAEKEVEEDETAKEYDELIFSSDKPIPPHVSKAIDTITKKGIPVTKQSLRNHIPWKEISTTQRVNCTEYIKDLEVSK